MPLTYKYGKTQHRQHHDNAFANEKLESFVCVCCPAKDVFWKTRAICPNSLCAVRKHVWVSRKRLLQSFIDPASTDPSRRTLHGSMNTSMLTIAPPLGRLILESGVGAALLSHSLTTDEVNS